MSDILQKFRTTRLFLGMSILTVISSIVQSNLSCWRRRATSKNPVLGELLLKDETLSDIALGLPSFDDVDFSLLNVPLDLTRLQAMDEIFPIALTLDVRGGDELDYSVRGNSAWIDRFSPLCILVDTYEFGLRVGSYHAPVTAHAGTLPITPASAARSTLLGREHALLDQSGGVFLRRIGLTVALTQAHLRLEIGGEPLDIPIALRARQETSVGSNEPLPDLFTRQLLAQKWRDLTRASEQFQRADL